MLCEGAVGNAQNELAVTFFGIDDAVGVVTSIRLQLEPEISNLSGHSGALVGGFQPAPGKGAEREPEVKVPIRVLLRSLPGTPWVP